MSQINPTDIIDKQEIQQIIASYNVLYSKYTEILESLNEDELNTVPYADSWTAAQVIQHIGKANHGGFLSAPGDLTDRDIGELIPMLEREFMNFETRMSSPEFLIPEDRLYSKEETLNLIQGAFDSLSEKLPNADLSLILDTPLGRVTKWELANFIVFHSKRHLHQLEKIQAAFRLNESPKISLHKDA